MHQATCRSSPLPVCRCANGVGLASFPGLSCFYVRLVQAKHTLVFRVYQAHVKMGKAWERG